MNTKEIKLIHKQRGYSLITWILIFSFFIMVGVVGFRLFPTYMEGYMVRKALNQLVQDVDVKEMAASELRKALQRRFYISNIKGVDSKNLQVNKQGSSVTLSLDYEIRVHAIANVDAVVKFYDSVTVN